MTSCQPACKKTSKSHFFAGIGKGLKAIDDATFSAVVIMVIVTTLITPPVLKLTLAQWEKTKLFSSTPPKA